MPHFHRPSRSHTDNARHLVRSTGPAARAGHRALSRLKWAQFLMLVALAGTGVAGAVGAMTSLAPRVEASGLALGAPAASSPGAASRAAAPITGILRADASGCSPANYSLVECKTGSIIALHALVPPNPALIGREVSVEGAWQTCAVGTDSYFIIESISPGTCSGGTPTPDPSPPAPGRDNVALRAPVVASGWQPGFEPGRMTDGDPATSWRPADDEVVYAYLDLGSNRFINEVVLRWGAAHASRYALYVWDPRLGDGGDWHRVHYTTAGRGGVEEITIARAESRFVLLWLVDSGAPDGTFDLAEWELYAVDTPNMALGAETAASSSQECCPAWHIADGLHATEWASDGDRLPMDRNPWALVRTPTRIDFSMVRLFWHTSEFPRYYRVHFYQDGRLLPLYANVENLDGGMDVMSLISPISIDTVLVYVDAITPGPRSVRLAEVELYESARATLDSDADSKAAPDASSLARAGGVIAEGARLLPQALGYSALGGWPPFELDGFSRPGLGSHERSGPDLRANPRLQDALRALTGEPVFEPSAGLSVNPALPVPRGARDSIEDRPSEER